MNLKEKILAQHESSLKGLSLVRTNSQSQKIDFGETENFYRGIRRRRFFQIFKKPETELKQKNVAWNISFDIKLIPCLSAQTADPKSLRKGAYCGSAQAAGQTRPLPSRIVSSLVIHSREKHFTASQLEEDVFVQLCNGHSS